MKRRLVVGALLAFCGCRTISLNSDPTVPLREANVSPAEVFKVDWWTRPLVKSALLEYQPIETATPAVDFDSERVIVSTRDGMVHCLAPKYGVQEWALNTHGRPFAGANVADGIAYIPGGDGVLYAVRVVTGETVWSYKSNEEIVTVPALSDDKVFFATQSETVFAVDRTTGKWVWQYRREPPTGFSIRGTATPVLAHGRVLMGFADGMLVALGVDDGIASWEKRLTTSGGTQFLDVDTSVAVDESGHIFAASYKDGLFALDEKTGDIIWTLSKTGVTSLLLKGSTLFTAGDGTVSAIDPAKGRTLWTVDLSDKSSKGTGNNAGRVLTYYRRSLVVPTSTALAFVDPVNGHLQAMWNPGRGVTATPMPFNSPRYGPRLFVVSNLGAVFALGVNGSSSGNPTSLQGAGVAAWPMN